MTPERTLSGDGTAIKKQTCINCKFVNVRTQIGEVVMDWQCPLKPKEKLTYFSPSCLAWRPKEDSRCP
jgi:hypothetical protein